MSGSAAPVRALRPTEVVTRLSALPGWTLAGDGSEVAIARSFCFTAWPETMAFVNAVAWIAQAAAHHPALSIAAGRCEVRWTTPSAGGLTETDFACAARVNALVEA